MTRADKLHTALISYVRVFCTPNINVCHAHTLYVLIGPYLIAPTCNNTRNVILWYMQLVIRGQGAYFKPISDRVVHDMLHRLTFVPPYVR